MANQIKKWVYPRKNDVEELYDSDIKRVLIISFVFSKIINDNHITNFRVKAPTHISLGNLFYFFINDYNDRNPSTPIAYRGVSGKYYGWIFTLKQKRWWQLSTSRVLDPFLTIEQNKLKNDDIIVASQSESEYASTSVEDNVPLDIIGEGNESVEHYLSGVRKENAQPDFLFEAKMLIIGEGGTGKTTFCRKIQDINATMPEEEDTTLGITTSRWTFKTNHILDKNINNAQFHVNLWDFGGQKIYQGTHQIFFSDNSFYVLIADTREEKTDFSYWINTVEQLGGVDSSLVIILNKKYGHEQKFDETGYRKQFGKIIKEVMILDLKHDAQMIIELQNKMKKHLVNLPGIGAALPPSWITIRKDLLNDKLNYISFDKFQTICSFRGITDLATICTISKYFHRIGVFVHYIDDILLHDRIFLNSNWLVKIIYKILDSEVVKAKRGRLNLEDLDRIWSQDELQYESKKIVQLMNKFGLMYHIPACNEYIVPSHLPNEMPYSKWEFEGSEIFLQFIYEFDIYVPKGIMPSLIVGLNHHIKNHDLVWHKGINISFNGAYAEIMESYRGTNMFTIRIAGINKRELLAIIREKFSEIIRPFNRLNFKQLVPCICDECIKSNDPAFHDYNLLYSFNLRNIPESQCSKSGTMVAIDELLQITTHKARTNHPHKPKDLPNKTIKIFLACSLELKEDRKDFEIFINRENKLLNEKGIFIELVLWEDSIDAMSQSRLQEEYNRAVAECDIFLSLFFTKVGKYTAEEFEKAHSQFKKTGKPLIYTYFKSAQVNLNEIPREDLNSKFSFEERLKSLGHFPSKYKSIEDLQNQFRMQIRKVFPGL